LGSINQLALIRNHYDVFLPPFLEVGSKAYDDVARVSSLFPEGKEFVGVDMQDGENVDYVIDLTKPFSEVDEAIGGKRFKSIFCLSVMEHCDNPFLMADNLSKLLKDDGILYVSVPHSWKFHGYPSDYWRVTQEGVKKLFPDLNFDDQEMWISTDLEGDIRPLKGSDLGRVRFKGSFFRKQGKYISALAVGLARFFALVFSSKIVSHRYFTPPVMIDMIGRKQTATTTE
jgi:hypothetical protein